MKRQQLRRAVVLLGMFGIVVSCKTAEDSRPKAWGDAIETTKLEDNLYLVICPNGRKELHSGDDLLESGRERVCIADRNIFAIKETFLKSESLDQPGGCVIPANTIIRLAKPLSEPRTNSERECSAYSDWYGRNLLQACRNFSVEILQADLSRLRSIGSGNEPCRIASGKIEGPMATTEERDRFIRAKDPESQLSPAERREAIRQIPARFIYADSQLGYPRAASYPSYPSLPSR